MITNTELLRFIPAVEGPIAVDEHSHPFASSDYAREPLNLADFGYTEEEYFLSGKANVYEGDVEASIQKEGLPYKNRIMIRKPAPDKFSGRVFVDIYNASNGYDIEDVWRRSYQYYLENGHIYIGVTSKPINVLSLKNFDYNRYSSLNWSSGEAVEMPTTVNNNMSIPGTEEGLVWDIISQLGNLVRNGNPSFLNGYDVKNVYLTGQSQSGMYLNTYVYYFHQYVRDIFDGYLNVVGTGMMRELNQNSPNQQRFSAKEQLLPKGLQTPFILLSAEGDINLFGTMGDRSQLIKDISDNRDFIRHYELAGAPHTDPASPLIPKNSEIVKTKNPPKLLDGEYLYEVNSVQLAYYTNTMLEKLHNWATQNITPPDSLLIDRDSVGRLIRDLHGNSTGGLRSPYLDVPIAVYHPNAIADPTQIDQSVGNVNGSMNYFTVELVNKLYGSFEDYLTQFNQSVDESVEKGLLLEADGERMKAWASSILDKLGNGGK